MKSRLRVGQILRDGTVPTLELRASMIIGNGSTSWRIVRDLALQCRSWTAIASVTPQECRDALRRLDGDDVDALVQVGTNLSMVRLAPAAEIWLGKPVIAINTATYWHALRANGIDDKLEGFGRLLSEF